MIDTVKVFCMINRAIYEIIQNQSTVKTSYNKGTGQVYYTIVNDSLEGTYNSSLSVRVGEGKKYKFTNGYYIEIEGSYHKIIRGFNSHKGFYNLINIVSELIKMVENAYKIKLPEMKHWFLQRVDIATCYDLKNQNNIRAYINNLNCCNYPRRKLKHYEGESIYLTGETTTLKIYNKQKEFEKNDLNKLKNTNFDYINHLNTIKGFIRFECEIKKRKLKYILKKDYIRIYWINYEFLRNIWYEEFKKLFKILDSDLEIVREREKVKYKLNSIFESVRARNLYNFYLLILLQGLQEVKQNTNKSMYYKNISDLKKAGIDFAQKLNVDTSDNIINFNPFESEEIL